MMRLLARSILAVGLLVLAGATGCRLPEVNGGRVARSVATAILNAAVSDETPAVQSAPVRIAEKPARSHGPCPKSIRKASLRSAPAALRVRHEQSLTHAVTTGVTALKEVRCTIAAARKATAV